MRIPQFDPINTVQDLVNQNITIFEYDYMFVDNRYFYLGRNTTEWDQVANNMVPAAWIYCNISCEDTDGTYEHFIKHHLHGNKTHAFIKGYLWKEDLEVVPERNNWWRSNKLDFGINPYGAVPTSRNWILNEVKISLSLSEAYIRAQVDISLCLSVCHKIL